MPSWKDFYGSKYLTAKKLGNRKIKGKIVEVTVDEIKGSDGKSQEKICLRLSSTSEKIALNATNAEIMAKAFGDDYLKWEGRQIEIGKHKTQFAGTPTDGLLIRPIGGKK